MSKWEFKKEGTESAGANVSNQFNVGGQPCSSADVLASKRNVILTELGWVRRENFTDTHGNARTKDEILVAAHPAGGFSYAANTYGGGPDIAQIYPEVQPFTAGVAANVYVVFTTPVTFSGGAGANNLTFTVANTVNGAHAVATCTAGIATTVLNANNTLKFTFPAAVAGSYQVNAQSISVTGGGNPLYNPDQATVHSANLVISGASSNGLGTFTVV
jgi:hypothetical protein